MPWQNRILAASLGPVFLPAAAPGLVKEDGGTLQVQMQERMLVAAAGLGLRGEEAGSHSRCQVLASVLDSGAWSLASSAVGEAMDSPPARHAGSPFVKGSHFRLPF